ncbi:hypothetical protein HYV12_03590 [Candidatus Dojkabacteria bacterium]|nr:hypothetical protein [Candidatus Dojkabacteria bacterium]
MKIKLPKFKLFLRIILAAFITSLLISTILIALPQTEKIYSKIRYDITIAPKIWKKEYRLEMSIKPKDRNKREKKVAETKAILEKRLRKYGVQEIHFKDIKSEERDTAVVLVTIESDKDQTSVENILTQRYYLRFVLRKEGVNFEDEKNQFALYDINNYTFTPYTLHDFRSVYITKLKSTSGEKSYFSIYKPWEYKAPEFYKYFDKYAGQYAGLAIDGFVSPIIVPVTAANSSRGVTSRNPFALGVNGDGNDIKLLNILNNTGVIPLSYAQTSSKDLKTSTFTVDYIKAAILLSVLTLTVLILNNVLTKRGTFIDGLSYFITATTVVAGLKLFAIPVQPIIIIYVGILLTFLVPLFLNSRAITIAMATIGLLLSYIGMGYIRDAGILLFVVLTVYLGIKETVTYLFRLFNQIASND